MNRAASDGHAAFVVALTVLLTALTVAGYACGWVR